MNHLVPSPYTKWGIYTPIGGCYTRSKPVHHEENRVYLSSALAETDVRHLSHLQHESSVPAAESPAAPVRAALWLAGGLIALGLSFHLTAPVTTETDFVQNVWLPSRLVLNSANPYKPSEAQVGAALGEYRSAFKVFNSGASYHSIYPIWMALAMAPLGAAPLPVGKAIWCAANVLLLIWGIGAVMRASNRTYRSVRPAALAALAVALLMGIIFRESLVTFLFIGQFAILEFALLVALWGWLLRSGELDARQR